MLTLPLPLQGSEGVSNRPSSLKYTHNACIHVCIYYKYNNSNNNNNKPNIFPQSGVRKVTVHSPYHYLKGQVERLFLKNTQLNKANRNTCTNTQKQNDVKILYSKMYHRMTS